MHWKATEQQAADDAAAAAAEAAAAAALAPATPTIAGSPAEAAGLAAIVETLPAAAEEASLFSVASTEALHHPPPVPAPTTTHPELPPLAVPGPAGPAGADDTLMPPPEAVFQQLATAALTTALVARQVTGGLRKSPRWVVERLTCHVLQVALPVACITVHASLRSRLAHAPGRVPCTNQRGRGCGGEHAGKGREAGGGECERACCPVSRMV